MRADSPPARRSFSWPLAFALIFLALLAFLSFLFWRIETWPGRAAQQTGAELERVAREVRDAFVQIAQLQPRVTIKNRVYLEKTIPVAELAILTRKTEVEHEFEHSWAGSTKRVKLHGSFLVKAGFDLRDNVSVDVRDDAIAIQMPPAKILGVEQTSVDVLEYENGFWNRISAEDLQNELTTLPRLAREKAMENGLTSDAEAALRHQLDQRLGPARPLRLHFGSAQPAM